MISGTIDNDASQGGPYSVEITASDGNGGSVIQSFVWTVTNPAPVATNDGFSADEDDTDANVGDALANDNDPDNDGLDTLPASGAGSNGGLFSIDGSGNVNFDPNGEFNSLAVGETDTTTFSYTIVDGDGATDTAVITVTIHGENDSPNTVGTVPDQSDEDTDFASLNVSGFFSDPDATDSLTFDDNNTLPPGLTIHPTTGLISGTLDNDASQGGPYTVEITASDGNGGSVVQSFEWAVTNPLPVASDDSYGADEDDADATVGNVLGNDNDPDNDGLSTIVATGAGSNGGRVLHRRRRKRQFRSQRRFQWSRRWRNGYRPRLPTPSSMVMATPIPPRSP